MGALPAACQKPSGRSRTSPRRCHPGASTNSASPPIRRRGPGPHFLHARIDEGQHCVSPARQARASRLPTASRELQRPRQTPGRHRRHSRPSERTRGHCQGNGIEIAAQRLLLQQFRTKGRRDRYAAGAGQYRSKTRPSGKVHRTHLGRGFRANGFIGRHCTGRPSSTLFRHIRGGKQGNRECRASKSPRTSDRKSPNNSPVRWMRPAWYRPPGGNRDRRARIISSIGLV